MRLSAATNRRLYGMSPSCLSTAFTPFVKTDLLDDQTVFDLQDGGAGKAHRLAGVRLGEPAERHVGHRRAGLGAAPVPLADDVVAFSDEVRGPAERQIRKRCTDPGSELPHGVTATERFWSEYSKRMSGGASSSMIAGL